MHIMTERGWQPIRFHQPVIKPGKYLRSIPDVNPYSTGRAYIECIRQQMAGGYNDYGQFKADRDSIIRGVIPNRYREFVDPRFFTWKAKD